MFAIKRKVIQIANSTHLVSLPRKWALRNNIKKGQEIEVTEDGDTLLISADPDLEKRTITLKFENFNERVVRWTLSSAHKSGFDDIEILFDDGAVVEVIEDLISNLLIGFVVIEQSENRCLLRAITRISKDEYEPTLRRAFLIVITMGKNALSMLEKGNLKGMKNLVALEHTNNQLTNFCERILNKFGSPGQRQPGPSYVIPWNLEKVCDSYKHICMILSANPSAKISKPVTKMFREVNDYVEAFYKLYYDFKMQELTRLAEKRREMLSKIHDTFSGKNRDEIVLLCYLHEIIERTTDFAASMVSLSMSRREQ